MGWQEHQESALAAIAEVGVTQERIAALRDKIEADLALITIATGGSNCNMESGRNAFEFTAAALEALDGLYRHTEEIIAELNRYAGGF